MILYSHTKGNGEQKMNNRLNNLTREFVMNTRMEQKQMRTPDKAFLQTIMKRQYYVLRDLYTLHDDYPELIDKDVVASLDVLFRTMHDMANSAIGMSTIRENVK